MHFVVWGPWPWSLAHTVVSSTMKKSFQIILQLNFIYYSDRQTWLCSCLWWAALGCTARGRTAADWAARTGWSRRDTPRRLTQSTDHWNKTLNFEDIPCCLLLAWHRSHRWDFADQNWTGHQFSLCGRNRCSSIHRIAQLHQWYLNRNYAQLIL